MDIAKRMMKWECQGRILLKKFILVATDLSFIPEPESGIASRQIGNKRHTFLCIRWRVIKLCQLDNIQELGETLQIPAG